METSTGLVAKRIIQVYDTRNSKLINLETNENQWSRILPLIAAEGINMTNVKAVVGSTKGTLELPDALIPDGNQQILLAPSKMSSGAVDKDFTTLGYNELRREAKSLGVTGLGSNPSKDELIKAIKATSGLDQKATTKVAKTERIEKVAQIVEEAKSSTPNLEDRVNQLENSFGKFVSDIYKVVADFLGESAKVTEVISVVEKPKIETPLMSREEIQRLANSIKR